MLSVDGVSAGYGRVRVLKGISLEVRQGEVVCIIGANGAGKSTLLKTISGLVHPEEGVVRFEGQDITRLAPQAIVRLGISQVPEGRQIFGDLTVEQNLALGTYPLYRKVGRAGLEAGLEKVFERFPILQARRTQLGQTLSGGEQQMLAIGRALLARPRLLMMDEPSMGLAPRVVETIFQAILDLHGDGTTILLVEQSARLALAVADRGYVLETGEVTYAGSTEDLRNEETVRRAYLGGRAEGVRPG